MEGKCCHCKQPLKIRECEKNAQVSHEACAMKFCEPTRIWLNAKLQNRLHRSDGEP